jgi:hypothetical protein
MPMSGQLLCHLAALLPPEYELRAEQSRSAPCAHVYHFWLTCHEARIIQNYSRLSNVCTGAIMLVYTLV